MKQPAQSRGAVDHTARAKRLRDRAEECRTLARIMRSEAGAAAYLRYAEGYDALTTGAACARCCRTRNRQSAKLRKADQPMRLHAEFAPPILSPFLKNRRPSPSVEIDLDCSERGHLLIVGTTPLFLENTSRP